MHRDVLCPVGALLGRVGRGRLVTLATRGAMKPPQTGGNADRLRLLVAPELLLVAAQGCLLGFPSGTGSGLGYFLRVTAAPRSP